MTKIRFLLCAAVCFTSIHARAASVGALAPEISFAVPDLARAWAALCADVRDRNLTFAEKTRSVDGFFEDLRAAYARAPGPTRKVFVDVGEPGAAGVSPVANPADVKAVLSLAFARVREQIDRDEAASTEADELRRLAGEIEGWLSLKVDAVAHGVPADGGGDLPVESSPVADPDDRDDVVQKIAGTVPPTDLLIKLGRRVVALEEERVFRLLTRGAQAGDRIRATADLAEDLYFLLRQTRGLIRLGTDGVRMARGLRAAAAGPAAERTAAIRAQLRSFGPTLVRTGDDLGVYYSKLTQSLSSVLFHLDEESFRQLDHLQGRIPQTLSYQEVFAAVERDLGRTIGEAFVEFDREPFANGTVSQVHRAVIRGRFGKRIPVAVKIQKASALRALRWNLATNDIAFDFLDGITPGKYRWLTQILTTQARGLGDRFADEFDFAAEADRQGLFGWLLPKRSGVRVPRVYRRHSGREIMTTELIDGAERLHDAFPKSPPQTTDFAGPTPGSPSREDVLSAQQKIEEMLASLRQAMGEVAAKASAERSDADAAGPSASLSAVMTTLFLEHGYRVSPRYLQLLRATIPAAGLLIHLRKVGNQLAISRAADDPELKRVRQIEAKVRRSFYRQLFVIKEVHADYNWGNLVIDSAGELNLIDWHTVSTKGLIGAPLRLAFALLRGDAKAIVKHLGRLGTFTAPKSKRADVQRTIQRLLDEAGVKRLSYFGLLKQLFTPRKKAKVTSAEPAAAPPTDAPSAEAAPGPAGDAKPTAPEPTVDASAAQREALGEMRSAAGRTAVAVVTYPFARARVIAIRGTFAATRFCQRALGGR